MRKINTIAALIGGMGVAFATASAAQAAIVDTFSFTIASGWNGFVDYSGWIGATPNGVLNGSFTGTVEPDGYIELSDLTAFSATFSASDVSPLEFTSPALFSFDTTGGAGTLDFTSDLDAPNYICVGAAVSLDPSCARYSLFTYPLGTSAVVQGKPFFYISSTPPTVTLVSSVTTTPLPATLALFASGLGALGLLGWRRKRKAQAVAAV